MTGSGHADYFCEHLPPETPTPLAAARRAPGRPTAVASGPRAGRRDGRRTVLGTCLDRRLKNADDLGKMVVNRWFHWHLESAGWGLWQITCGNSDPQLGSDFQVLDP